MSERYVDPNSGAAPQPGGFGLQSQVAPEGYGFSEDDEPKLTEGEPAFSEPEESNDVNVTLPEDANPAPEQEEEEPVDQGKEELPDELIRSKSYDTEIQNQAAPLGPQPGVEGDRDDQVTVAGGYLGAGIDDPAVAAEDAESDSSGEASDSEESEAFDPADHNVDDVVKYVEANPDQRDAVVEAEKSGKNRSTLLTQLEG